MKVVYMRLAHFLLMNIQLNFRMCKYDESKHNAPIASVLTLEDKRAIYSSLHLITS